MRKSLMPPTANDVPDEAIFERSEKNLAAWLGAIKAGEPEAIGRLLELLQSSWGDEETEFSLVEFMRKACDQGALEELLDDWNSALDFYVDCLIDDARYDYA